MVPPHVSRVSHLSTTLSALAPGSAIVLTGKMIAIVLAGAMIPIALAWLAFLRRTVLPNIRVTTVAAPNTDQDAWPTPIATVDPT